MEDCFGLRLHVSLPKPKKEDERVRRGFLSALVWFLWSPASAQDMSTGTMLHIDACERHRIQMAEMTRGKGANSNNIAEFAFFIEVTAYLDAFNTYTGIFNTRDDALEWILKACANDPALTIGEILYRQYAMREALLEQQRRLDATEESRDRFD